MNYSTSNSDRIFDIKSLVIQQRELSVIVVSCDILQNTCKLEAKELFHELLRSV